MKRATSNGLTDREAQIMDQLWELGTATAEQIRLALPDKPHDSTVRTLLRILEEKGFVNHKRDGKTFVYRPAVARKSVQQRTLRNVIKQFFSGSPQDLVLRLLEDEKLSADELKDLMAQANSNSSSSKTRKPAED